MMVVGGGGDAWSLLEEKKKGEHGGLGTATGASIRFCTLGETSDRCLDQHRHICLHMGAETDGPRGGIKQNVFKSPLISCRRTYNPETQSAEILPVGFSQGITFSVFQLETNFLYINFQRRAEN